MNHCYSCGSEFPGVPRRMCRVPEVHAWFTPEERAALPVFVRSIVEFAMSRRGILPSGQAVPWLAEPSARGCSEGSRSGTS